MDDKTDGWMNEWMDGSREKASQKTITTSFTICNFTTYVIPIVSFCKISFPVKHLMPHYAKTGCCHPPNQVTFMDTFIRSKSNNFCFVGLKIVGARFSFLCALCMKGASLPGVLWK
jgi:hypothetical protein